MKEMENSKRVGGAIPKAANTTSSLVIKEILVCIVPAFANDPKLEQLIFNFLDFNEDSEHLSEQSTATDDEFYALRHYCHMAGQKLYSTDTIEQLLIMLEGLKEHATYYDLKNVASLDSVLQQQKAEFAEEIFSFKNHNKMPKPKTRFEGDLNYIPL